MTRTLSISLPEQTYQDLKKFTHSRQVSKFVNELITQELAKRKQRWIAGYQRTAHSAVIQQEDQLREGVIEDGIN